MIIFCRVVSPLLLPQQLLSLLLLDLLYNFLAPFSACLGIPEYVSSMSFVSRSRSSYSYSCSSSSWWPLECDQSTSRFLLQSSPFLSSIYISWSLACFCASSLWCPSKDSDPHSIYLYLHLFTNSLTYRNHQSVSTLDHLLRKSSPNSH